jgi:hypothetical protein
MGTNVVRHLADLFIYSWEEECIQQLIKDKIIIEAKTLNFNLICVWVIDFTSSYDCSIEFWNCYHSDIVFVFFFVLQHVFHVYWWYSKQNNNLNFANWFSVIYPQRTWYKDITEIVSLDSFLDMNLQRSTLYQPLWQKRRERDCMVVGFTTT